MIRPLAIVVALTAAIGAADSRTDPFAVGVMRRDGILIPLATYDGKQWGVSWPGPALDLEIPISISSVPKPWWGPAKPFSDWQLWPLTGEARTVHATQPDWVPVHCARQIALRTDYRSDEAVPPATEQPYPKDGLVVSPPWPVERVTRLSQASADAIGLPEFVRMAFNEAEEETANQFGHPVKRAERENQPVVVEAIYTHGTSPRVFYVEAVRRYTIDNGGCALSFGTGWFASDETGAIVKVDMAVDLLRCNRDGARYMLPLGVVRAGDRTFWVVQFSGWDHERFVIAEIKKDRVNAAVIKQGGSC
jgi:hypothetical protein